MNKSRKGTILASQDEKLTFYSFELEELKEVKGGNFAAAEHSDEDYYLISNSQIIST